MLALDFDQARFERDAVRADYDLEVGVVANLTIRVAKQVIYQEVMFPVVELRIALDRWVRRGPSDSDFEFISMESDEAGLVWFRCQASGYWRVGSIHQDVPAQAEFAWQEVADAVERYVAAVDQWVATSLGVRIADVVDI